MTDAMDERERDFLVVVGYVCVQHGRAEQAADVLEAVLVARPHDRDAIRLLAYAYLEMTRFQECLDLTDYLLGGHGQEEPAFVWLIRARALYGLGHHEQARELWNQSRRKVR